MGEKQIEVEVSQLKIELGLLLKTKKLENEFYERYYEGQDKLYLSMLKFKADQLEKDVMSEFQFVTIYTINKQDALERLFKCTVTKNEINLLEIEIRSDRMSLSKLFTLKEIHKKRRLMRLLFSTTK